MTRLKAGKQPRSIPTLASGNSSKVKTKAGGAKPSTTQLLAKAQSLVVECDFDLARKFLDRILQQEPNNVDARELLGVVLLELGDVDAARETFRALLDSATPPPPSAHLYLAQMEENPHSALVHYESAIDLFTTQLKGKSSASAEALSEDELKASIIQALCAMVEIWMSDLCMEENAEASCDALLSRAAAIDDTNPDALQSLASCRMSQNRPDEARAAVERSWTNWKDLDPDDVRRPEIPQRIALAKLFLELAQHYTELALFESALAILRDVLAADDQDVMGWYLEGWCYLLMSELSKKATPSSAQDWTDLAHDARECLESCKNLHVAQQYEDLQVLQHVEELLAEIAALNLPPRVEEDGDVWTDDEDEDGDVDMA